MRVISVLPSATEIVYALGHGAELVGRSAECDYPEAVQALPVVMRPRTWDADRPSREIDARVQAARSRGQSLYELDIEEIRQLRPDLLLTQDLCGVCSVTEEEVIEGCRAAGVSPKVLSLSPRRLSEVSRSIDQIAEALGDRNAGAALRARSGIDAGPSPMPVGARPHVAIVEWLDPPILAGLWTPDIVAAAGGIAVGPSAGQPGERTTWGELAQRPIDLLILSPCSFSVARTRTELNDPKVAAGVDQLRPRLGRYLADEAYFSRPGPRLAEGIRLVRRLIEGSPDRPPMPVEAWRPTRSEAAA